MVRDDLRPEFIDGEWTKAYRGWVLVDTPEMFVYRTDYEIEEENWYCFIMIDGEWVDQGPPPWSDTLLYEIRTSLDNNVGYGKKYGRKCRETKALAKELIYQTDIYIALEVLGDM